MNYKGLVMRIGRWVFAFSVWILASLVAVALVLIGFKLFSERQDTPPPAQEPALEIPDAAVPRQDETLPKVSGESPAGVRPDPSKPIPRREGLPRDSKTQSAADGKIRLCPGISDEAVAVSSDGSILGHLPYATAASSDLSSPPSGFNNGNCGSINQEAKSALNDMIAAATADDPNIGRAMVGLSCFRSSAYQKEVFCRKVGDGFAVRARSSAPPGHSEHATGFAMDFGDQNHPECNLSTCFSTTPVGQWLAANAGRYGFVLSFPKGNSQGVMYEPWHWRYEGSARAKAVFSRAR